MTILKTTEFYTLQVNFMVFYGIIFQLEVNKEGKVGEKERRKKEERKEQLLAHHLGKRDKRVRCFARSHKTGQKLGPVWKGL